LQLGFSPEVRADSARSGWELGVISADIPASYMNNEVSSDKGMVNNKFAGATSIGASDFHSRLIADTASQRRLKAREAFTIPFRLLCDYADQSDQHMYFIATRLEILKDDIAVFH
jgi:hypothetical protein